MEYGNLLRPLWVIQEERREDMYFLERKEPYTMPNVLGNRFFSIHTYRWKVIARCEEKEHLEEMMSRMDLSTHRITSNFAEEEHVQ